MRFVIIIAMALAGTSSAWAADGFPNLDIRKTCQAAQTAQNGIADPMKKCMDDEKAAKAQLQAVWAKTKPQAKNTCASLDADSPYKSYADVLTCVQMYQ